MQHEKQINYSIEKCYKNGSSLTKGYVLFLQVIYPWSYKMLSFIPKACDLEMYPEFAAADHPHRFHIRIRQIIRIYICIRIFSAIIIRICICIFSAIINRIFSGIIIGICICTLQRRMRRMSSYLLYTEPELYKMHRFSNMQLCMELIRDSFAVV